MIPRTTPLAAKPNRQENPTILQHPPGQGSRMRGTIFIFTLLKCVGRALQVPKPKDVCG